MSSMIDVVGKEKLIKTALQKFDSINSINQENSLYLKKRIDVIHKTMMIGFGLFVSALFCIILVVSTQMYHTTKVINIINDHFSNMNDDMNFMLAAMSNMDNNVNSMTNIVHKIDAMNGSVSAMSEEMVQIYHYVDEMNQDMGELSQNVTRMQESFKMMNLALGDITGDTSHISQPMRLFNVFNPFW